MNGYLVRDPEVLALVGLVLSMTLLAGLAIVRLRPGPAARLLAWSVAITATVGVERFCRDEPAGIRMLVIVGALLYGMKAVVGVETRAAGMTPLAWWQWLGFAALWPGMRPGIFANAGGRPQPGGWGLVAHGCLLGAIGLTFIGLADVVWRSGMDATTEDAACVLATAILLVGLSLVLHFGIFNVAAGLWRLAGVDARSLFRSPLAARSLDNFWSRRWNLAFSEMTALGVYRPLALQFGRRTATGMAFLSSGLLHELAISLPVMAGFGLPMTYFLFHGLLVQQERRLEREGRPITGWGWASHLWVLAWLALPIPILFHKPFLRGVVWPIIGIV